MRILISGQTYYPASNGQAVFTVHLAEGLAAAGHEVMAVVPSYELAPYSRDINGVRVEGVRSIPWSRSMPDVYFNLPAGRRVARLFDEFGPQIVHIQDHDPLCRCVVAAARRRDIPTMGTNHFLPENVIHYLKLPVWTRSLLTCAAWIHMLDLFNRLNEVTTPTTTAAAIVRAQRLRPPVQPISCGVDMTVFRPDPQVDRVAMRRRYKLDPERVLFLFVGRTDQEKRIDVLMRALSMIARDDVQVAVAGRGRYSEVLEALARELGLGERLVFTGYVPAEDLPGLLNAADAFVMPSEAELQSIATLEAMASGRPVIAARARALPELVDHDVNGYLFRPGDAADLAHWMIQLVEERARWPEMGAAAQAKVRPHSVASTVLRYEEMYRRLAPQLARAVVAPAPRSVEVENIR